MKHLMYLLPVFLGLTQISAHAQDYKKVLGKAPIIKTLDPAEGGSGVGGGNLYSSIIYWCNESTIILQEAKAEAIDLWGFKNDRVGAVRTFYEGMLSALNSTADGEINFNSSITYRVISRGLGLAQALGVPQIINGDFRNISKDKDLEEIMNFMNFYYDFIAQTTHHLDKKFYAPYFSQKICKNNCTSIPEVQTIELEREMVKHSTSLLTQWRSQFVKPHVDGGLYTNIQTTLFLRGLNYLGSEVVKDLNDSLFRNVYECQLKQLQNLNAKVQLFLSNRGNDTSMDAIELNKFVMNLDSIVKNIEMKDCH